MVHAEELAHGLVRRWLLWLRAVGAETPPGRTRASSTTAAAATPAACPRGRHARPEVYDRSDDAESLRRPAESSERGRGRGSRGRGGR